MKKKDAVLNAIESQLMCFFLSLGKGEVLFWSTSTVANSGYTVLNMKYFPLQPK